jgi:ribosomal protein S18 acetylase RimI-like enzyme
MMQIRQMEISDYDKVCELWHSIKGFAMRSIDDSYDGIDRFIKRNPGLSTVAMEDDMLVGAILCGHDGRRATLYHVCVKEGYRKRGIGKAMVVRCMEQLEKEGINKVALIAFTTNDVGNAFWKEIGWTERKDLNYYDFTINPGNIVRFNT